ncbi:T9SS type A sorting domain-containing protein [Flavobacterium oreochromis]|uniref:T9SS type A sorting domain-containing protein n=2 Tax=Flavobacterium oreochromis TaxID=2906078 RepID=UPI003858D643
MKNYLIIALLFLKISFYSQSFIFDQKLYKSIENKAIKFDEINRLVEESFKNRDIDVKGSGWKVYQRWKYIMSFEVDENGYLPNSYDTNKMIAEFKGMASFNDKVYRKTLNNLWTPAGPFTYTNKGSWSTGQGRVNCSVTDPNDENIIYIGAAAGGVWKSIDGGLNWSPKTDFIESIAISGLAIDPNNTNILYAMTGDADGRDMPFGGLYKSNDGGETWRKIGGLDVRYGRSILVNPNNSNVVIVGTDLGIYRSEDGGLTFRQTSNSEIVYQLAFHPTDPNIVYASNSSGADSFIYKSIDNGITWEIKKTFVEVKKMLMATTQADPNYLYLLGANTSGNLNGFKGIYLSVDSGENFVLKNDTTDILESYQSYYDLAFAASQTNKDLIYTGCLNLWNSNDGGVTFVKLNSWNGISSPRYTHADIHNIRTVGSNVYVCSDGGIYISKDAANTFTNRTGGLQISQFYKMDTSPLTNSRLVGGLQDNGGFTSDNDSWANFYGADGMDAAINPLMPHLAYGFTQNGGGLYEYNFNSKKQGSFIVSHSKGEWVTPLEISNTGNIYGGWKEVEQLEYRSWKSVTANSNGNNIRNMKVNPLHPNRVLYYRKSAARPAFDELIYTDEERDDLGKLVPKVLTLPTTRSLFRTLSVIEFNPVNPDIFYIVYASRIYKTADSGKTWADITFNFPNSPIYCLAAQGNQKNSVYVGTSLGVYYFDEESNSWSLFNNGLPRVRVTELKINVSENNLTASTYGRGIWRVALPSGTLAVEEYESDKNKVNVYPNPSNGIFKLNVNININEPLKMAIYDITGKVVFEKTFNSLTPYDEINISDNPKGIYLLDIKSDQYTIRKKILIK